ncbi:hypothetical protein COCC4DRAFT_59957 [Bipolaris maydis ATCC 48331]|uniref:Uncharacterized protein n=2 Tax=Cochliobolus heterostrophus TaxID=5016 RepID=M2UF68_COCH5|nr:uncharacterized protein COCC4DRAFT_59957 [Bipolaris maydis ATCC 48331]EMD86542.1 hypothetical protein COCHEDRAFT_1034955 [Bipolaris maydis C5]ENI06490.1 hypothetical protein COCC4DRAFT_59957 [Bipolaris maydis ATCC 48331]
MIEEVKVSGSGYQLVAQLFALQPGCATQQRLKPVQVAFHARLPRTAAQRGLSDGSGGGGRAGGVVGTAFARRDCGIRTYSAHGRSASLYCSHSLSPEHFFLRFLHMRLRPNQHLLD